MADIETLGVAVEGRGITETRQSLDGLTESAGRAEVSTQRLRDASGGLSRAQQEVVRMAREVAAAVKTADLADAARVTTLQGELERVRQLAAATQNLGLVERDLAGATQALADAQTGSVRTANAMTVSHGQVAASTDRVTGAFNNSVSGLSRFGAAATNAVSQTTTFDGALGRLETAVIRFRSALGVGLIGAKVLQETIESQNAMAQLEAAVKATGGSAGRTVAQMDELSNALQRTTTFSDEAVKGAETMLTTFDKVKGDTFDRATRAAADLAARMGTDVVNAAQLVGKALQEPDEGLAQLNRQFRLFSQSEQQAIKDLVDAGHAAEAQGVILAALEAHFGGAAAAARDTLGGALIGLAHQFGELFEVTKDSSRGGIDAINKLGDAIGFLADHSGVLKVAGEALATAFAVKWITAAYEGIARLGARMVVAAAETAAYAEGEVRLAAAEVSATAGTNAHTAALARHEAALIANTASARAAAGAVGLLEKAMAPFGGPVGVAIIAAFLTIRHAFEEEGKAARTAASDLDVYKQSLAGLTAEQQRAQKANLELALAQSAAHRADLARQINALPKGGEPGFDVRTTPQESNALGRQISEAVAAEQQLQKMLQQTGALLTATGNDTATLNSKVAELTQTRQREVDRLAAVNQAYGQSALASRELEIHLDALAKKAENAKEIQGLHLDPAQAQRAVAQLNAITDALERQQLLQARLATIDKGITPDYSATIRSIEAMGAGLAQVEPKFLATDAAARAVLNTLTTLANAPPPRVAAIEETSRALRQSEAEATKLSQVIGRELTRSILAFATDGVRGFDDFFRVVQRGAETLANAFERSMDRQTEYFVQALKNQDIELAGSIAGKIAQLQKFAQVAGAVNAAASGAVAGYGIGRQVGAQAGQAGGFLAGAGAGALAGSAFGPLGAAIGGLTGAAGGLLGASEAQKQAAEQFKQAIRAFQDSTQKFLLAASGSTVGAQIIDIKAQADALKNSAIALATLYTLAGRVFNNSGATATGAGYKSQADQIADAVKQALARIESDFFGGIERQFNNLRGPAGEYANTLNDINRAHEQNVANVRALAATLGYSDDKTKSLIASMDDLAAAQEAAARAAFEAAQLHRRAEAVNALATAQAAGPQGTLATQQTAALSPLYDKLAADTLAYQTALDQLSRDIAGGADQATIDAEQYNVLTLSITKSGDEATIAARKWADAIAQVNQAVQDIQQDVALGFVTTQAGLAAEQQQFGFGGLAIDQIRALYTTFAADTPLTNEQRETNRRIAQFLADFDRVNGTLNGLPKAITDVVGSTANNTAVARDVASGQAVSYAARNLSEITDNRMADYLATEVTLTRQIRDILAARQGFGAAGFTATPVTPPGGIPSFAQPLGYGGTSSAPAGALTPSVDFAALLQLLAVRQSTRAASVTVGEQRIVVEVRHRVDTTTGKIDRTDLDAFIEEIAGKLEDALLKRAELQRLTDGSPLLART